MEIIDKITIDMAHKENASVIYAVQGEFNTRTISSMLLNNGVPFDVKDCVVSVAYKKPDGTSGWYDTMPDGSPAFSFDYPYVFTKIAPEMLSVPGLIYAAIRIESANGKSRATTFPFIVDVSEDPGYNAHKSENYYNVQNWDDVNSKFAEIEEFLKTAGNEIDDNTISNKSTWSSKNIVDKLCPSFTESGGVVCCEPLEGYPLEVVSTINEKEDGTEWERITLTQCGKNLFDFKQGVGEIHFTSSSGSDTMKYGYAFRLPAGTYAIHAEAVASEDADKYIFCYANDTDGKYINLSDFLQGGGTNTWLRQGKNLVTRVFEFDRNVVFYVYQGGTTTLSSAQKLLVDEHNIQIEVGTVQTAYEPYRGQTLTTDFTNLQDANVLFGSYNWQTGVLDTGDDGYYQHDPETNTFIFIDNSSTYVPPTVRNIPAMAGTNAFYSDCGDTTVIGKADPVAIIKNLTNAILATGGNV